MLARALGVERGVIENIREEDGGNRYTSPIYRR
jgi:hypothetical protein